MSALAGILIRRHRSRVLLASGAVTPLPAAGPVLSPGAAGTCLISRSSETLLCFRNGGFLYIQPRRLAVCASIAAVLGARYAAGSCTSAVFLAAFLRYQNYLTTLGGVPADCI